MRTGYRFFFITSLVVVGSLGPGLPLATAATVHERDGTSLVGAIAGLIVQKSTTKQTEDPQAAKTLYTATYVVGNGKDITAVDRRGVHYAPGSVVGVFVVTQHVRPPDDLEVLVEAVRGSSRSSAGGGLRLQRLPKGGGLMASGRRGKPGPIADPVLGEFRMVAGQGTLASVLRVATARGAVSLRVADLVRFGARTAAAPTTVATPTTPAVTPPPPSPAPDAEPHNLSPVTAPAPPPVTTPATDVTTLEARVLYEEALRFAARGEHDRAADLLSRIQRDYAATAYAQLAAQRQRQLAAAPPAPRPPGAQRHDGFFIRLAVGVGGASAVASESGGDRSISGPSGVVNFTFGYCVIENLAITFDLFGGVMIRPTFKSGSSSATATEYDLNSFGFGAGVTYYVMPLNLYVAVSLGGAAMSLHERITNRTVADSSIGFGTAFAVGKEWWVSDNWGLGVAALGYFMHVPVDEGWSWNNAGGGIAFSATFN